MHRFFSPGIAALLMITTGPTAAAEPAAIAAKASASAPNMNFSLLAPA
ncbi:hypothetical protein [Acaryochloris thomasi]|nr:hypothetical protein [Acaryochloris thomasi]